MKRGSFEPLLSKSGVAAGALILDVGCATGSLLAAARDQGLKPYGIDRNPHAIERARQRVPTAALHVGVLDDDAFAGVAFDAIVMTDFLEHVRDPFHELGVARRRLAPGGVLAITTPRVDSLSRRVLRARWPQYREEHLTYFSRAGLHHLLARAGFSVRRSQMTWKAVTLSYLHGQAQTYPDRVLTPLTGAAYRLLPPLRDRIFRVAFGEMTVISTSSPTAPSTTSETSAGAR
jgi:SAM-dependent methyltransferase